MATQYYTCRIDGAGRSQFSKLKGTLYRDCPDCKGEGATECQADDCDGGEVPCDHGGKILHDSENCNIEDCDDCRKNEDCDDCHGGDVKDCPDCKGKGEIKCEECHGKGKLPVELPDNLPFRSNER